MWYRIIEITNWFKELTDRYKVISDFNKASKDSFISGVAPTLLQAKISSGDSSYRHQFSKWRGGGFRIKALSGRQLERAEMVEISRVILGNEVLVRKLISMGWDTLEVHDNKGNTGCKWELQEYANIGGFLT